MKNRYLILSATIVICLILIAIFLGFFSRRGQFETQDTEGAKASRPAFQPPVSVRPDGFLEYKNFLLRFDLFYPSDLSVTEFDDGTSASTITFKSKKTGSGFQIFVVPYDKTEVTPEQFKKDSPLGVMKEPVEIMIDGTRATMFFGQDAALGETREVWFIKNGFLYEISSFKSLDGWLSKIMATWRFL